MALPTKPEAAPLSALWHSTTCNLPTMNTHTHTASATACTPGESAVGAGPALGADHFCQRGGGLLLLCSRFLPCDRGWEAPTAPLHRDTQARKHTQGATTGAAG